MAVIEVDGGRALATPLESNGIALSSEPHRLGWLTPTDPAEPMERLRERYARDGYLWLKGILNKEEVLEFRRRYFERMREAGLIKEGTDPTLGIYSNEEDAALVRKGSLEVVRWAAYEGFGLAPPIVQFYERFFEGPVYLHKRKIIRHKKPQVESCTPAHYDLVYLRGGTDKLCSSWIPIGDIPVEMGGLVYLEGSDAIGRQLEAEFNQKAKDLPDEERISAFNSYMNAGWLGKDLAALAERFDTRWLMADYEVGDMVVHSAYMIHASTRNTDVEGRIRLSTDIRYQYIRDEIDVRWQNHWSYDDML